MPSLNSLTPEENKQYSRHLILDEIGEKGQLRLKNAKVLVIGAGGLGCPVLQYLTAAGVGTIGVVDGDKIEISNLQRQILFTTSDIGKYKVNVAIEKLTKLNPLVHFVKHQFFIGAKNVLQLFKDYDIIVDGTDNFPTRYLVNDACVLTGKPLVFGSIFKFQGQVSVFNYKGSATYRCLYPQPPKPGSVPNCSDIGVLGVLPGIIGTLQANEVLKLILQIGDSLINKLMYIDALTLQQQILHFEKNEDINIKELEKDYHFFCGVKLPIEMKTISAEAFKENIESYNILDVRTYEEFEEFNVGGYHIPLDELEERMGELPNSKQMVVCCASGIRSAKAIELLKENYFPDHVYNLEGGLVSF